MNIYTLSDKDKKYVTELIKDGTEITQAFVQLQVLKKQSEFKADLINALYDKQIQEIIGRIVKELMIDG